MKPIRVAIVGCGRISDLHEIGYHAVRMPSLQLSATPTNRALNTKPGHGVWRSVYRLPTGAR